jgi:uncharacterized membrane protein
MRENSRAKRALSAILFSLIIAAVFALAGCIAGMYFWSRFGQSIHSPDDTDVYLIGQLVGGVMAIAAGAISLWKFWPKRARR